MEHQADWFIRSGSNLLLNECLVLGKQFRVQLDVTGLVDTVDITESCSDGEVWGDGRKSAVDVVDILGLGVERGIINALIVNTIFFATGDANFLRTIISISSNGNCE